MNFKKSMAAAAAAAIVFSSVSAAIPVFADDTSASLTASDSSSGAGCLTAEEYAALSDSEKSNYVLVNHDDNIIVNVYFGSEHFYAENGEYIKKSASLYICALTRNYSGHDFFLNGTKQTAYPSGDAGTGVATNYGFNYTVSSSDSVLSITLEKRELTDDEKSFATVGSISDYVNVYEYIDDEHNGKRLLSGMTVKKDMVLRITVPAVVGYGQQITVNGEIVNKILNGDRSNFLCYYTVKDTDTELNISMSSAASLTPAEQDCFASVNIADSKINAWSFFCNPDTYDGNDFYYISSGDHVVKGKNLRLFINSSDYSGEGITVNGVDVPLTLNDDGSAYLGDYFVSENDTSLNISLTKEQYVKVSYNPNSFILPYEYLSDEENGQFYYNGSYVKTGSVIRFVMDPNIFYGKNITINGNIIPIFFNGDKSSFLTTYTVKDTDTEINIAAVKKDELSEDEKNYFVPVTKTSDSIYFSTWYYNPYRQDTDDIDCHNIFWNSGAMIKKGTYIDISVTPNDYNGKKLTVNGETLALTLNGDSSAYIGSYLIKNTDTEVKLSLENDAASTEPTKPTVPTVTPSSPTFIPSTGAGVTYKPYTSMTAESFIEKISTTHASSITYNSSDASISKDILTAFAGKKSLKSLTAFFGNYKAVISKADITDKKKLADTNFGISGKNFLSQSAISDYPTLSKAKNVYQFDFTSKGTFEGIKKVTLMLKTDNSYRGKTAVIYELKDGKLIKLGTSKVNGQGFVKINTDHLGQIIAAVQ